MVVDVLYEKFWELYLVVFKNEIDLSIIDYIVCNYIEFDYSGLILDFLELVLNVVVVGLKVCI